MIAHTPGTHLTEMSRLYFVSGIECCSYYKDSLIGICFEKEPQCEQDGFISICNSEIQMLMLHIFLIRSLLALSFSTESSSASEESFITCKGHRGKLAAGREAEGRGEKRHIVMF